MDLKAIWQTIYDYFAGPGLGQTILIALLIYIFGGFVIRFVRTIIYRTVMKTSHDDTLARFVSMIAHQLLRVILIIAILGTMGVDTTSLAAMLGGAGVALGFALRDTLGNLAAGILLIVHRPFNEGDVIEAAGVVGKVEQITIASTKLSTPDNKSLVIPNGLLSSGIITNFSRKDTRRVDLVAGIGYDDDIDKARGILDDILAQHPLVLADPAPLVAVSELADSSVNFLVRPWCKTEDYWTVSFEVTEQIKKRFDEAGVSIPFPQQDVHMHQVA